MPPTYGVPSRSVETASSGYASPSSSDSDTVVEVSSSPMSAGSPSLAGPAGRAAAAARKLDSAVFQDLGGRRSPFGPAPAAGSAGGPPRQANPWSRRTSASGGAKAVGENPPGSRRARANKMFAATEDAYRAHPSVELLTLLKIGADCPPPRIQRGAVDNVFERLTSSPAWTALKREMDQAALDAHWTNFLLGVPTQTPEDQADIEALVAARLHAIVEAVPAGKTALRSSARAYAQGKSKELVYTLGESDTLRGGAFLADGLDFPMNVYRNSRGEFYGVPRKMSTEFRKKVEARTGKPYSRDVTLWETAKTRILFAERLKPVGEESQLVIAKMPLRETDALFSSSSKARRVEEAEIEFAGLLALPNTPEFTRTRELVRSGNDVVLFVDFAEQGNAQELQDEIASFAPGPKRAALQSTLAQRYIKPVEVMHAADPPVFHQDIRSLNYFVNRLYQLMLGDFGSSSLEEGGGITDGTAFAAVPKTTDLDGNPNLELTKRYGDLYLLGFTIFAIDPDSRELNRIADDIELRRKPLDEVLKDPYFDKALSDEEFVRTLDEFRAAFKEIRGDRQDASSLQGAVNRFRQFLDPAGFFGAAAPAGA